MVRKAKNPQHSTKKQEPIKTVEDEYYRDMFTLQMNPISEDYLLHFALQWIDCALKESQEDYKAMLTLEEFYIKKGVYSNTVYRWMKRCPELKEAHDYVMMILGSRREKGALYRELDSGMVRYTMPMFNPRFKEIEEWRENLKQKVDSTNANAEVIAMVAREMLRPLKGKDNE